MIERSLVYDGFTFFNELDVLEIRLSELSELVDYFVLVEAPLTFVGSSKPLYFADNKERFSRFLDRIIHVVVDDLPPGDVSPWTREVMQRNAIMRGLAHARPFDRIMISDVDEIPKPDSLSRALRLRFLHRRIVSFTSNHYFHRLNLCATGYLRTSPCPKLVVRRTLDNATPNTVRAVPFARSKRPWTYPVAPLHTFPGATKRLHRLIWPTIIWNGAWHFSSIGDADHIRMKLRSWSHADDYKELLALEADVFNRRIAQGEQGWLAVADRPLDKVAMRDLPKVVQADPPKYAHILA